MGYGRMLSVSMSLLRIFVVDAHLETFLSVLIVQIVVG